ncbi:unnamed protein product [Ilex paraguariensis]|uniref:Snakin-1 n=1 Tax=Ilex paraguariensis TaxID=185542 RepID=A0ABC8RKZ9_9AQUA
MKLVFATLLLVTLLLGSTFMPVTMADSDFCKHKCKFRCSEAKKKPHCLKDCHLCCKDCHCVPSGTYGNKDECPCYRDKKNERGKPKCP